MTNATTSAARHPASRRELERDFVTADLDKDKDRRLSLDEFRRLLQSLESGLSDEELRIGFHEVDTDLDGLIDFGEFMEWWNSD